MNKENGWDASASWNGYMYQAKVALLVTLKKINSVTSVKGFWLESEGIEDFSIGVGDTYESIHQVKNRKDEKIEDYREALSNIVKRMKEHPEIGKGYLHTKSEIKIDNWEEEIKKQLLDYYPEKIQKIEKIANDLVIQKEIYKEILNKWNDKTKKINRNTKDIYKLFINELEKENNFTQKTDITEMKFLSACKQVLKDEKENYDFAEKKLAIDKIELYKYSNNNYFADSSEVIRMTLEEIEKYWGEMEEYRKEKKDIYYMQLLRLINDNITDRAENRNKKIRISLEEFKIILDKNTAMICDNTKEEALLKLKYLYLAEKEEFCTKDICEVKGTENCGKCKLEEISEYILSCSLSEIEAIFHIMSLHKNGRLTKMEFELFSKADLENIFFAGITEIDKEFFIGQCKVLCQIDDKFLMATTIDAEKSGRKKLTIEGLVKNDIKDICNKVINNDGYDTTFMEVDKLVTKNFDTEDIFSEACNIVNITENDDKIEDKLRYMNITKTKKVGLISIEKAKKKYGERK